MLVGGTQPKAKKPHVKLQFRGVSVEVHAVSISDAVGDGGLSYPGSRVARVQGLGYGECLVSQLEEDNICIEITSTDEM